MSDVMCTVVQMVIPQTRMRVSEVNIAKTIDQSRKSHNTLDRYPQMHNFVTEMCTCVHISVNNNNYDNDNNINNNNNNNDNNNNDNNNDNNNNSNNDNNMIMMMMMMMMMMIIIIINDALWDIYLLYLSAEFVIGLLEHTT